METKSHNTAVMKVGIVGMHVFNSRGVQVFCDFWNYFTKILLPHNSSLLSYVMRMVSKD